MGHFKGKDGDRLTVLFMKVSIKITQDGSLKNQAVIDSERQNESVSSWFLPFLYNHLEIRYPFWKSLPALGLFVFKKGG